MKAAKTIEVSPRLKGFLSNCKKSSESTIAELSLLLQGLEDSKTKERESKFLNELVSYLESVHPEEAMKIYHLLLFKMEVPDLTHNSFQLQLLQLPSTFAPEEWSYTFFEGLSRYSFPEFNGKKMVELGCGNGWITISMAKKYNPDFIYGLDINPRSILCSKLNLYINALDNNGNIQLEEDGRSLIEKVDFHESDLLNHFFKTNQVSFDLIIGCIPQVLAPSDDLDLTKISDIDDDELLHSLSNYTIEQGYVEDKFGLGLIAKAVEQSIDLIKPDGKIILNLGGRPGEEVLEQLFKRRGFLIKKIWQRKVSQADDTDIDSLIRIEKEMGHHFEFFADINSESPINARTAKAFAENKGTIYHNLTVYECTISFYNETKHLFEELKNDLFAEAKLGLDLDYEDAHKKEEKVRFLAGLTRKLNEVNFFPYENTKGEITFRNRIAAFLNSYHHTKISHDHILVAPNLDSLVDNIINIYNPGSIFLPKRLFEVFTELQLENKSFCVPDCSTELNLLIEKIKPEIVVGKVSKAQSLSYEAFKKLIDVSEKSGTRVILDISENLELTSTPKPDNIFKYIASHGLPLHITLICELSKNQIYSDLKTCFVISNNSTFLQCLINAAEFSYSRTPFMSQLYYAILLGDLLSFHMTKARSLITQANLSIENEKFSEKYISPGKHILNSFEHPAIKGNSFEIKEDTVRFDYGENELNCPEDLKITILEGYTKKIFTQAELDPTSKISQLIKYRFGINHFNSIVYGNGVAPLFAGILKLVKKENGTILFPQGAYGYFYAAAIFYDIQIKEIPTNKDDNFLLNAKNVKEALKGVQNPWIFINFPLVNPTGAFYTDEKLQEILNLPEIENTKLVIDTIFSGLEFNEGNPSKILGELNSKVNYILLGGISKEYAAGGIRFGFAISNFDNNLSEFLYHKPHKAVLHSINHLLLRFLEKHQRVQKSLKLQREVLKDRAMKLSMTLKDLGWDVIFSNGGLFMVASPKGLNGKKVSVSYAKSPLKINASNISEILYDKVNLLINNDVWTGIPGYCRFVLSVEDDVFEEGLKRIKAFHELF